MMNEGIEIHQLSVGPLQVNCFLVACRKTRDAMVVDPGDDGNRILQLADKEGLKISKVVNTHGHFDHTGGLAAVLKISGKNDVYAHPDVFNERFAVTNEKGKDKIRSVGLPEKKEDLCALGAVFHFNKNFDEVFNGVYLTGEIPRKTHFEKEDKRLAVIENNEMVQDLFKDDQSLVIKTEKGLVVILGCAHSGMINTLDHIKGYFTNENFHMVIGGTHMGFLDDLQVEKTIESLKVFNIDRIGVSHCTGLQAAARLKQAFGKKFFFAQAGTIIKVS